MAGTNALSRGRAAAIQHGAVLETFDKSGYTHRWFNLDGREVCYAFTQFGNGVVVFDTPRYWNPAFKVSLTTRSLVGLTPSTRANDGPMPLRVIL